MGHLLREPRRAKSARAGGGAALARRAYSARAVGGALKRSRVALGAQAALVHGAQATRVARDAGGACARGARGRIAGRRRDGALAEVQHRRRWWILPEKGAAGMACPCALRVAQAVLGALAACAHGVCVARAARRDASGALSPRRRLPRARMAAAHGRRAPSLFGQRARAMRGRSRGMGSVHDPRRAVLGRGARARALRRAQAAA